MTDTYLRSLGFAPTEHAQSASRPPFSAAWRYQHEQLAQDGAPLFIEHPFGVDRCRLSMQAAPLSAHDVVADLTLHDRPALEAAVASFYAAHGGKGAAVDVFEPHQYLPYRRQR